ncbi:MAG: hypothetical protein Q6L60_06145 [Thermostichus sp. HHBFW_bins_43]
MSESTQKFEDNEPKKTGKGSEVETDPSDGKKARQTPDLQGDP